MSTVTPNAETQFVWGNTRNPNVDSNTTDVCHIIGPGGDIVSWIDSQGLPGGNLGVPGPAGPAGATGTISATSGPSPWVDIQALGAFQRTYPDQTTTVTTTGGIPNVTLGSAIDFQNGQGIVIYGAGAATSQSTPSSPTLSAPFVTGNSTYKYAIVGIDALGGLTAASATATINTGPAVLGNLPVAITSISQTSGTVTVNLASAINASEGQMITIQGVTGSGSTFNGLFPVASAPTTSQVTYSLSGNAGSGTVGSGTTGRLCNAVNISAISRSGGTISITTTQAHNYNANGVQDPTICVLVGNTPTDLNGQFIVTSASGSSISCGSTGVQASETGTQFGYVTVYECIEVLCPAPSSPTITYYIYSDSPNPGGTLKLIGKLRQGELFFRDYGPWLMQGFKAPAYVPTTAPNAAQNQLFASTILSGAGTTSIVLNNNVTNSVSGATCVHDDGQAILAADTRCSNQGGGTIYLSPSNTADASDMQRHYTLNYPITVSHPIMLSGTLICNETLTAGDIQSAWRGNLQNTPQFSLQAYVDIGGIASPLVYTTGNLQLENILFFNEFGGGNGQTLVLQNANTGQGHTLIRRCAFVGVSSPSTMVGLACLGEVSSVHITDVTCSSPFIIPQAGLPGQTENGPPIPMIYFGFNPIILLNPGLVTIDGICSMNARGIGYDFTQVPSGQFASASPQTFVNVVSDFQGPQTPFLMFIGSNNAQTQVTVKGVNVDSAAQSVIGNWNPGLTYVIVDNCEANAGSSLITGSKVGSLAVINSYFTTGIGQDNSIAQYAISQSLTTTNATSDIVSVNGAKSTSKVSLTPTNSSAAADIAAGNTYVSAKASNQITVTHGATAGMTFDILVTPY